jgi:hypothetical protein
MNALLFSLAVAIGLALLAGTLRSIKQNLIRRPPAESRPIVIEIFQFLESSAWWCVLLAMIIAIPHPLTALILGLFVAAIYFASHERYLEESRSLNDWVRLGAKTNASLLVLIESLAIGYRSQLSWQAKGFVARIARGESLVDAARRSELPLDADTIAEIMIPSPRASTEGTPTKSMAAFDSQHRMKQEHETSRSTMYVSQQLVYVVGIVLLAWVIGFVVRKATVPTVSQIVDEFSVGKELLNDELRLVVMIANGVVIAMTIWLLPALSIRWLPLWMVRAIPWFGREAIDRWRCVVLRSLARGVSAGQPADALFRFAGTATRVRWIRYRCLDAARLVENGSSLPVAMQQTRMISPREQAWLSSAEKNAALATAIEHLARNLQRRQTLLWKLRMTWLVPLTTVLVAIFVLTHAMYLFQFMSSILVR